MSIMLKKKERAGFSLIELAIMMMIVGLMSATALQVYKAYSRSRSVHDTTARFSETDLAFSQFLTTNGRLPCPASMTDNPDLPTSGIENCAFPAIGSCVGGICSSPGIDVDGIGGPDAVISGYIPYVSLGIAMKDSLDGWGKKIEYVVTAAQTVAYTDNGGAINMLNPDGSFLTAGHMLIFSHGEDGGGAYTIDGKLYSPCPAAGRDRENCDEPANATYYDHNGLSFVPGAGHYDDMVYELYKPSSDFDSWAYLTSPVGEVRNKTGRRVGIGTTTPQNDLDVNGNIKASEFHAVNFCNNGGALDPNDGFPGVNCIKPGMFGGTGIICPGGTMIGISSGNSVCANTIKPGSIVAGSCAIPGQVVCGIDSTAHIKCHNPGALTCP